MVHALLEVERGLKSGGCLIDLRPAMRNRRVELELARARLYIGEIDSSPTFPDHVAADEALAAVVASGRFRLEHRAAFEYVSELDSAADLREYAASLRRSITPEAVLRRVEALTADEADDFVIRIRREMVIARYRRQVAGSGVSSLPVKARTS